MLKKTTLDLHIMILYTPMYGIQYIVYIIIYQLVYNNINRLYIDLIYSKLIESIVYNLGQAYYIYINNNNIYNYLITKFSFIYKFTY